MKIIPFPGRGQGKPNDAWHIQFDAVLDGAELDGAVLDDVELDGAVLDDAVLDGEGGRSAAAAWRELRTDVRALATPMTPQFERQLRARLTKPAARRRPRTLGRSSPFARLGAGAAVLATTMGVLAAVVMIAAPWRTDVPRERVHASPGRQALTGTAVSTANSPANSPSRAAGAISGASGGANSTSAASAPAAVTSAPARAATVTSAPARVQQLAASISLATTPEDVQETANRVSRLAVSDGGFVQSSHVQVQRAGISEANLMLRLPSARLSATLASLGGLASVRAQSQSLQDITDSYDAARRRVADLATERQALLRALGRATTQGQIDSLREQLSQNRSATSQARSALQAISKNASTAEVEVSVVGDARAGSEGLTLHRGLHDAGRVLVVTLVVLLIAAAILVPLTLLAVALVIARRAWHRYRREQALSRTQS
jgi:hypothetical protein